MQKETEKMDLKGINLFMNYKINSFINTVVLRFTQQEHERQGESQHVQLGEQ